MGDMSDMMGELRSAVEAGDLSGLDLGGDPQGVYRHYLAQLPTELLATGAWWVGVDHWESSFKGAQTLVVCGVEWWSGETWRHAMRWEYETVQGLFGFGPRNMNRAQEKLVRETFESESNRLRLDWFAYMIELSRP